MKKEEKTEKKSKKKIIIIIIIIAMIVLGVAGYFLLTNSGVNFGFGADFSKGSVDFGAMGDSNTFKDVKLNPFNENG